MACSLTSARCERLRGASGKYAMGANVEVPGFMNTTTPSDTPRMVWLWITSQLRQ